MTDLIRPLRAVASGGSGDINLLATRAADEIERLRALLDAKVTPGYELLAGTIEELSAKNDGLHEALKVADAALCEARTFIASRADEGWAWLDQSRATIRAALSAAERGAKP